MAKKYFAVGEVEIAGAKKTVGILVPKFTFSFTTESDSSGMITRPEPVEYTADDAVSNTELLTALLAAKVTSIISVITGEEAVAAKAAADAKKAAIDNASKLSAINTATELVKSKKAELTKAIAADPDMKELTTKDLQLQLDDAQKALSALLGLD